MDCQPNAQAIRSERTHTRLDRHWRFSFRLLAWGLIPAAVAVGAGGCLKHETIPVSPTSTSVLPRTIEQADSKKPARQPRPETYLAYAKLREQMAHEPSTAPDMVQPHLAEAEQHYQNTLKLDPHCTEAYVRLAQLVQERGNTKHAQEIIEEACQQNPEDPSLFHAVGLFYARTKEWDSAIAAFHKAVELAPNNEQYVAEYGYCLGHVGNFDESYAVFERTFGAAIAHYKVARMLHHGKQDAEAERHAQAALQLQPQLKVAQELLAELHGQTPVAAAPTTTAAEGVERAGATQKTAPTATSTAIKPGITSGTPVVKP